MGRFDLACEFGSGDRVAMSLAFGKFNSYLATRPHVLGIALQSRMNGTTPPVLVEAMSGFDSTTVDDEDLQQAHQVATSTLRQTNAGRTLGFAGGDPVHGAIWDETRDVRALVKSGARQMEDLGLAMLATSVALTIREQNLATEAATVTDSIAQPEAQA